MHITQTTDSKYISACIKILEAKLQSYRNRSGYNDLHYFLCFGDSSDLPSEPLKRANSLMEMYTKLIVDKPQDTALYKKLLEITASAHEKYSTTESLSQDEQNLISMKVYNYETYLNFGKYKGNRLFDVLSHDPEYIAWCIQCVLFFVVNPSILIDLHILTNQNFDQALEINEIKFALSKDDRWYYISDEFQKSNECRFTQFLDDDDYI